MGIRGCVRLVVASSVTLPAGCGLTTGPADLPPSVEQAANIAENENLTPQEKREQLREIGYPDDVINALLVSETQGNQFGGDLTSAFDKVSGGRLTELTPDEVQIYAEAVGAEDPAASFNFSDAAAQATVDLFIEAGLSTRDQLGDYLANPANEVPGEIPDGALQAVFVDFDPNDLIDQLP